MTRKYRTTSDEEIVEMIVQKGRSEIFGVLYERYSDKVYRKCLSFERDRDAAQDLAHDVFVKVFLQLSKFEARSRFSTWLYSVTYNHCVEHHRKKSKMPTTDIDEEYDIKEFDESAEQELFKYRFDILKKALDKANPEDKAILMMKYQDDFSIKDLMVHLSISESAVKMRLARARERVKHIIDQDYKYD